MIKYNLICSHDHEFEVWFSKGTDFDEQSARGLLSCPHCADTKIEKAIMAPAVSTSRKKEKIASHQAKALAVMNEVAAKVRKEIETNCDDVGQNFADEARAIHYGEKPERGIYGKATPSEAADLRDEGVGVMPLPDALAPKGKGDVH